MRDSGKTAMGLVCSASPQVFSKPMKNLISEHRKIINRSESPHKFKPSFVTDAGIRDVAWPKLFNNHS